MQNNWEEKIETKKGNIGENIIKNFLEKKDYLVYKCITEKSHFFDNIIFKTNEQPRMIEIKTYARRNFFPDTGINYNHYLTYKKNTKLLDLFFFNNLLQRNKIISSKSYIPKIFDTYKFKIYFCLFI